MTPTPPTPPEALATPTKQVLAEEAHAIARAARDNRRKRSISDGAYYRTIQGLVQEALEHYARRTPPAPTVEEVVEAVTSAVSLAENKEHAEDEVERAIRSCFTSNERGGGAAGEPGGDLLGGTAGGPASPMLGGPVSQETAGPQLATDAETLARDVRAWLTWWSTSSADPAASLLRRCEPYVEAAARREET